MAQIIEFKSEYRKYIKELNYEWLEKYFEVEPSDTLQLNDPESYIINKGGEIYYAEADGKIVGTASLLFVETGVYELGKMAITAAYQGKGIANLLMEHCIERARQLHAERIILYSNKRLVPALNLYMKYGFKEIPLSSSNYKRSDIKMELIL